MRTTKNITVTLSEDDLKLIEELCKMRKVSKTELIREALVVYKFFILQKHIVRQLMGVEREGEHYLP